VDGGTFGCQAESTQREKCHSSVLDSTVVNDDESEVDANDDIYSTTPTIYIFVMQLACAMQYGQSTTAIDHNF
jgi:hypothetical protein